MARISCLLCKSFGHDAEIRFCSLCRMRVERMLRAGKTVAQIGGSNLLLKSEAAKVEAMISKTASLCPHCGHAMDGAAK